MDRQPPYPLNCPSCRKAAARPQRVTALTPDRKSITLVCEGCQFEWTVVLDVFRVLDARKPEGPRLDSDLRTTDFLFSHVRTGWRLLESAQKFPAGEPYKLTMDAAKRTIAAIHQLAHQARLTTAQREHIERELLVLQAAIESSLPRS
jgi:hypothetical protein